MTVVDLWVNALSGKAAEAFMGQAGNEGIPDLLGGDLSAASTLKQLLATMDECGVDVGVVALGLSSEETAPLLEQMSEFPDRLRAALVVDRPDRPVKQSALLRALSGHASVALVRVTPLVHQYPLNDKLYYPIYTLCAELELPVSINVGVPGPRVRSTCQRPELLEDVLIDFKGLTVIGAHMGHPYEALLMQYMLKWPDLYLSNFGVSCQVHGSRVGRVHGLQAGAGPGALCVRPSLPVDGTGGRRRTGPAPVRRGVRGLPRRHGRPALEAGLSGGVHAQPRKGRRVVERLVARRRRRRPQRGGRARVASGTARCGPRVASSPACRRASVNCSPATESAAVASGIASIWTTTPEDVAGEVVDLEEAYDGRFLFGIGASHHVIVSDYARPYSRMVEYLDGLDALERTVPREQRILAALGPRMLELARNRAAGAHPYFVPVEHTAFAREKLGPGPLLAPEVAVVLSTDRAEALELARQYAAIYLPLPNYANNLRRFGYTDDDFEGGGSDRLIEAVIPWGDAETIARRVRGHLDAGADHVCIQVVADFHRFPLAQYRELAPALFTS